MILRVLIRVLEAMFLIGIIGSAIVVLLTTLEDIKEFFFTHDKQELPHDRNKSSTVH